MNTVAPTPATGTAAADSTLHRLLDRSLGLPPETRTQLTSHLPMALQALHAMGADDARLRGFFAGYAGRFEGQAPSDIAPPVADWRALRGAPDADAYPALRTSFAADLEREGAAAVLQRLLPDLLPGAAAAAFHGPIRVAHALQSGHRGELAAALAYWAWRWQPLAPPKQPHDALEFEDWAKRLVAAALQWTPQGPLISIRMQAAETSEPYQALAGALRLQPGTLQRLSVFAAGQYTATKSFTVLHIVTGLRALRLLLPLAGDGVAAAARPGIVHALTAAYLAARMGQWPELPPAPLQTWAEVRAAALQSDDDHVIKIVHACIDEASRHDHPAYLAAASRAVG